MKKLNFLMIAAAMTIGLVSCSKEDNAGSPVVDNTDVKGNLIIKEFNVGGGFKTTEGKSYGWCKAIVLYNNSSKPITATNLAIGTVPPGNAHANNGNYDKDGKLVYENADWLPMTYAIWYIPSITVAPFSDAVVAINGAIDHTALAPDAINLADPSYYAMYEPESQYNNPNAYPAPFEGIPTANYWKGAIFGLGNAWAVSIMSPNFVLFQFPEGVDPKTYCADKTNVYYDGGKETAANYCVKIKKSWVIDGVETYRSTMLDLSVKRLTADIDAGYGLYNSNQQYSAYRNIDEKATVNYGDNISKLVYNYADGVEGTTDPSGIDAAASAKNGAKIIYQDTNNSTADFHLRKGWSLK